MQSNTRIKPLHEKGFQAPCEFRDATYLLIFGLLQIMLSQVPNIHDIECVSFIANLTAIIYSAIGLGLSIVKVRENGYFRGTRYGVETSTVAKKVWLASQAIGNIAFAYPFSIILIAIQDTIRAPPPENETIKKASGVSVLITAVFYLFSGFFGYAAFGNATPGNLLTGFGFYEPYWLVDIANACIAVNLVLGYQVYSQPLFAMLERWSEEMFPESVHVTNNYSINLYNILRHCIRSACVMLTTASAFLFPYFNEILGLLGAINFWPLTIFFPVEMYLKQRNIQPWTAKCIALRTLSAFGFLVTLLALVGSIDGLVIAKSSSKHRLHDRM